MTKKVTSDSQISMIYFGSIIAALSIHHFLISKINIHATWQTAISFTIFTLLMGIYSIIFEKK